MDAQKKAFLILILLILLLSLITLYGFSVSVEKEHKILAAEKAINSIPKDGENDVNKKIN